MALMKGLAFQKYATTNEASSIIGLGYIMLISNPHGQLEYLILFFIMFTNIPHAYRLARWFIYYWAAVQYTINFQPLTSERAAT